MIGPVDLDSVILTSLQLHSIVRLKNQGKEAEENNSFL